MSDDRMELLKQRHAEWHATKAKSSKPVADQEPVADREPTPVTVVNVGEHPVVVCCQQCKTDVPPGGKFLALDGGRRLLCWDCWMHSE